MQTLWLLLQPGTS